MLSLRESFDVEVPDFLSKEVSCGTTIVAAEYKDGVVIGADSRTSSGSYIANRVTDKLTQVSETIYCCRSGSAADTQAVADIVRYRLKLFKMENNEEPSVQAAANVFSDICYNYRERLLAGIICAGWDKRNGGRVYTIPLGGMLKRETISIGGSGSTYIYGFLDSEFRPQMEEQECVNVIAKAIALAISRDGSSGGCIRIAVINKDGVKRQLILSHEIPKLFQK